MKKSLFFGFVCLIAILLITAGCTQNVQSPTTPATVISTVPTEVPTSVATPIPPTPTPEPTTIAPPIPVPVDIKDTPLLFTISAPDGYTGTTIRETTSVDTLYKTTIYNPGGSHINKTVDDDSGNYLELADSLTVFSYSGGLSQDQDVRNVIRGSGAAFNESYVTYNGISYTRFDVVSDPYTKTPDETVIFVGDKKSVNEKGYFPVIIYTLVPGENLNQATYENMVRSFQYYSSRDIGSAAGTETDRPSHYQ